MRTPAQIPSRKEIQSRCRVKLELDEVSPGRIGKSSGSGGTLMTESEKKTSLAT